MSDNYNFKEALAAVRAEQLNAEHWQQLGRHLEMDGDHAKAKECFEKAKSLTTATISDLPEKTPAEPMLIAPTPVEPTPTEPTFLPVPIEISPAPVVLVEDETTAVPLMEKHTMVVASVDALQCSKCSEHNPAKARFCFNCQWPLLKPCLNSKCERWISRIYNNCIFCGANQPEAITALKREAEDLRIIYRATPDMYKPLWLPVVVAIGAGMILVGLTSDVYTTLICLFSLLILIGGGIWWAAWNSQNTRREKTIAAIKRAALRYNHISYLLRIHEEFLIPSELKPRSF